MRFSLLSKKAKKYIFFPLAVFCLVLYGSSLMSMKIGDHFLAANQPFYAETMYKVSNFFNPFNTLISVRLVACAQKETLYAVQTPANALTMATGNKAVLGSKTSIPIFQYENIVSLAQSQNYANNLSTNLDTFNGQLNYLVSHEYNTLSLNDLTSVLFYKTGLPQKPMMITIDGGHESLYTLVFPLVKKYNVKIAAFIPTDFVDLPGFITWSQIQEMDASGLVSFGSETKDATMLSTKSTQEQRNQLEESRLALQYHLKEPVFWLSYPYTDLTPSLTNAMTNAGYWGIFQNNQVIQGLLSLPRMQANSIDAMLKDLQ